ncbi:MAG TPA: hypothetical protein VI485_32055 [Vicinamibacterales bacterium]|nr:hypothetical protein [Vicinamibacterales bacterium]
MPFRSAASIAACALALLVSTSSCARTPSAPTLPRTADGKPDLQGIWQVRNTAAYGLEDHVARDGMPAGRSVVEGGTIPYQPSAAAKRIENAANQKTADPLATCYMPGVPRIMYMDFPFQIFQTPEHIAITFEWSQVHRTIYTNGAAAPDGIDFWMGDSRGRWEGDTLVVDVRNHNDRTWFDTTGTFHSGALHVVERYTMSDADTIQYEATIEDPQVFTRPWKIAMPLYRHKNRDRILEYQCQAETEEANRAFEREPRTWYPGPSAAPVEIPKDWAAMSAPPSFELPASSARATPGRPGQVQPEPAKPAGTPPPIRRMADGKPDLQGYYMADGGGGNYGLGKHAVDFLTPPGRGIIVDPPDGNLPVQPWARIEMESRKLPERGYDDPTAHCFVAGVPRSMYVPSPLQILQPPGHLVVLHERMSWRTIALDGRPPLPDTIRLWQGDSVGKWDGDTLVVETTNLNGKTWLNEVGEIVSHAQRVIERFTPVNGDRINYQATISDPLVYTRPWTIALPLNRQKDELLEVACHEDNQDLQHLKDIRDEARARAGRSNSTR